MGAAQAKATNRRRRRGVEEETSRGADDEEQERHEMRCQKAKAATLHKWPTKNEPKKKHNKRRRS